MTRLRGVAVTREQHDERVDTPVRIAAIEDAHVAWSMRELDDASDHLVQLVFTRAEELVDGKALERR